MSIWFYVILNEEYATKVMQMPLYTRIWASEINGLYSIKSANRIVKEKIIDDRQLHLNEEWSFIWRSKVPLMVQLFLWRVCYDIIPTRLRLRHKGIDCPSNCVHFEEGSKIRGTCSLPMKKSIVLEGDMFMAHDQCTIGKLSFTKDVIFSLFKNLTMLQ